MCGGLPAEKLSCDMSWFMTDCNGLPAQLRVAHSPDQMGFLEEIEAQHTESSTARYLQFGSPTSAEHPL